jgi:hypothetical protein
MHCCGDLPDTFVHNFVTEFLPGFPDVVPISPVKFIARDWIRRHRSKAFRTGFGQIGRWVDGMQPVTISIDVKPQDIPELICNFGVDPRQHADYRSDIACAVAEQLGVEEFLSRMDRQAELRRRLWERAPGF